MGSQHETGKWTWDPASRSAVGTRRNSRDKFSPLECHCGYQPHSRAGPMLRSDQPTQTQIKLNIFSWTCFVLDFSPILLIFCLFVQIFIFVFFVGFCVFFVFVREKDKVGWVGRWKGSVRSQGKGKHDQIVLYAIFFQLRVVVVFSSVEKLFSYFSFFSFRIFLFDNFIHVHSVS